MQRVTLRAKGSRYGSDHSKKFKSSVLLMFLLFLILLVSIFLNSYTMIKYLGLEEDYLVKTKEATRFVQNAITNNMKTSSDLSTTKAMPIAYEGNEDLMTTTRIRENAESTSPIATLSPNSLTFLIPENGTDLTVWKHLELTWTDANNTQDLNLAHSDPHLKKMWGLPSEDFCPPTAQYRLLMYHSDSKNNKDTEELSHWVLQSLDKQGQPKTMGGDEVYVEYHHRNRTKEAPTAVAYMIDHKDGTYHLEFHETPFTKQKNISQLGNWYHEPINKAGGDSNNGKTTMVVDGGILVFYMTYTCGLGTLPHPHKFKWKTGGAVMTEYQIYVPYPPPHIAHFIPPNSNVAVDFDQYRKVVMFGDSNFEGLYLDTVKDLHNLHFASKAEYPLCMQSVRQFFLPKIAFYLNSTMYGDSEDPVQYRYALIIGSACWDIVFPERVGPAFQNHLRAMRHMLDKLKATFKVGLGGNVDIYWHSGFSLHLHVAAQKTGYENSKSLKYMSYFRSQYLYGKQVELLKEVGNITLLDFMHTTYLSGHHYRLGDARHAMPHLNQRLLYYYYPHRTYSTKASNNIQIGRHQIFI